MTDDIEKQKILDEYMTRIAPKSDNWVSYTSECVSTSIDPSGTKLAAINTQKTPSHRYVKYSNVYLHVFQAAEKNWLAMIFFSGKLPWPSKKVPEILH